jgi:hypothetical protein
LRIEAEGGGGGKGEGAEIRLGKKGGKEEGEYMLSTTRRAGINKP